MTGATIISERTSTLSAFTSLQFILIAPGPHPFTFGWVVVVWCVLSDILSVFAQVLYALVDRSNSSLEKKGTICLGILFNRLVLFNIFY